MEISDNYRDLNEQLWRVEHRLSMVDCPVMGPIVMSEHPQLIKEKQILNSQINEINKEKFNYIG